MKFITKLLLYGGIGIATVTAAVVTPVVIYTRNSTSDTSVVANAKPTAPNAVTPTKTKGEQPKSPGNSDSASTGDQGTGENGNSDTKPTAPANGDNSGQTTGPQNGDQTGGASGTSGDSDQPKPPGQSTNPAEGGSGSNLPGGGSSPENPGNTNPTGNNNPGNGSQPNNPTDPQKPNPSPSNPTDQSPAKPTPAKSKPLKDLKANVDKAFEKVFKVDKSTLPKNIKNLPPVFDKKAPNYFGNYYKPEIPQELTDSGYTLVPYTVGNEITKKPEGYNYEFYFVLVETKDKDKDLNKLFKLTPNSPASEKFFRERVVLVKINLE